MKLAPAPFLLTLTGLALAACNLGGKNEAKAPAGQVVATVDGKEITVSQLNAELAGGGLMDVGCYCLHFSRLVMGKEPTSVHAVAQMHENGVDEMTAGVLGFEGGAAATFSCGTRVQADNAAAICGTDGYLEVPVPWKPALTGASFTIARSTPPKQDGPAGSSLPPRQTITADATAPLYAMEADDFAAAVLDGAAPTVSRADSLGNMRVLDEIRRQIGLGFP